MDNIIEFPARPEEGYDGRLCPCGSAWFTVSAVCLSRDGSVTGYAGAPVCVECQEPRGQGASSGEGPVPMKPIPVPDV
jgi:hypothetical protein